MTFRYRKTPKELQEAFFRQVRHLRRSVEMYDQGHTEEAERLASTLYTLFFDGRSNAKSAAKLAGIKERLRFPDTRFPPETEPGTTRVGPPLCIIGLGGVDWPRHHLLSGDSDRAQIASYSRIRFANWWQQAVYITDSGKELSRMNLIFAMRNQDGGGLIDTTLKDEAYHWLSAYGNICLGVSSDINGWSPQFVIYCHKMVTANKAWRISTTAYFEGGRPVIATSSTPPPPDAKPIRGAHWASMRQIAWEANLALSEAGF